ncbi:MAG: DNA-binding response regulator [Bacteroidetes bacterium]|nr:MAG: DNA-binding response regulator [Bacteroidota bacterium]
MYNILLADDHPLILRGTKDLLVSNRFNVVGEYANGIDAYNNIVMKNPDLAILDISMQGMDGLDVAEKVQANQIPTNIILLTMHDELAFLHKAKKFGVKGYILKDFALEELVICIRNIMEKNETYFSNKLFSNTQNANRINIDQEYLRSILTPSEIKILKMIAMRHTTKDIANLCFISEKTVETHRGNIIKKLNIASEKNALFNWCEQNLML